MANTIPEGFRKIEPNISSIPKNFKKLNVGGPVDSPPNVQKTFPRIVQESFASRPTSEAIGAIGGSVIGGAMQGARLGMGAPLPPQARAISTLLGATAGGILGGVAGGQLNDLVATMITGDELSSQEQWERLGEDLKRESTWQPIFMAIPGIKPLFAKLSGARGKAAEEVAKLSERTGIKFGIADVPTAKVGQLYKKVIGIFPFARSPIVSQIKNRTKQIEKIKENTLEMLAPNAKMSDLGIDMFKGAGHKFDTFKRMSNRRYDLFKETAKQYGKPFIPTDNVKKQATILLEELKIPPQLLKGKKFVSPRKDDPVYAYMKQFEDLPGKVTMAEYESMIADLKYLASTNKNFDIGRVTSLKTAFENDLDSFGNILLAEEKGVLQKLDPATFKIAEKLVNRYNNAKEFYANGIKLFQTPSAKMFERVDKNVFKSGYEKLGSINPDKLAQKVIRGDIAPQDLKDLKILIGGDNFKRLTRKLLDDAFNTSTKGDLKHGLSFDPYQFEKYLGLSGNKELRQQALKEMFRDAGVNAKLFDDFLQASKLHADQEFADIGKFILRRGLIGGVKGVVGTIGMGIGVATNPFATIAAVIGANRWSKFITNPANLQYANQMMSGVTTRERKYYAAINLIKSTLRDKENTEMEQKNLEQMKQFLKENKKELIKGEKLKYGLFPELGER